ESGKRRSRTATWGIAALTCVITMLTSVLPADAQRLPLIRDSEIEKLLDDYARPIFDAAGLGSGRVAIRIVRSRVFNAFVLDGRNVFMHTGALQQADTPNQIIGIIAHEAGHITGGHMAALRSRIQRDQTRILLMRILGIGAAIATGNAAAAVAGDELVMRSLLAERRSQESAADQAGLTYLSRTGQSGRGMLETFERFAQQEYISDTYKDPFVRSHPVASHRIATLRDLARSSRYFDKRDSPELQYRHDLMRAKLAGYLEPPASVFNRYPSRDRSIPAQYARSIASFFRGGNNGLTNAIAGIDQLIKQRPNYPYFWELRGDLHMRAGRARDAIPSLQRALKLAPRSPLIQVQLAGAYLATNDRSRINAAMRLLRQANSRDQNPRAHRLLADAFYRLGRRAEADAATAQATFMSGNLKRAKVFARRAKANLKRGTPYWVRMDDILNTEDR
ncbi:MAG: M48 family metalloprotease, partial [Pseudomonadota bacterium]